MLVILLILIFIRPLISSLAFPYANLSYSILLLSVLALWILTRGAHLDKIKPIRYPIVLFILALLISLIFSQDKIMSAKELYKYITGILLIVTVASLTYKERNKIILCIAISSLLISLLAIYQYFFGFQHILNYILKEGISEPFILDYVSRRRVFFPFVTPNILAGYVAMIILLALAHKNRAWFVIPLSFVLLLTKSLGGLLSLFFGLVIYLCLQEKLEKRIIIFLSSLLIIIILVIIIRSATQKQHLQPIFSTIMRLNYWQDTLRIIKAHPLAGIGLGNFNLFYSRYAHNSYLQIWAEMGILGIISFLWLIIRTIKLGLHNIKNAPNKNQIASLIGANAVFLVHNFLDFSFFLPEVAFLWWIILGLIISYLNLCSKKIYEYPIKFFGL